MLLAVYTTVEDGSQAEALANAVVQQGLAACVQIELVKSTYIWQHQLENTSEFRLMIKTTETRYPALAQFLLENHPYALPAIYALPVTHATEKYAAWVRQQTAQEQG